MAGFLKELASQHSKGRWREGFGLGGREGGKKVEPQKLFQEIGQGHEYSLKINMIFVFFFFFWPGAG